MKRPHKLVWIVAAIISFVRPAPSGAGDLVILSEKTWDEFAPKGKEVDAIYGDFVLRNDKIVVVIANPVPGRNANMTVKDVGGSIIDLTERNRQSDQLSAYYPGRRAFQFRLARVTAKGNASGDLVAGSNSDSISFSTSDGELSTPFNVMNGDVVSLECVAPATADKPEVRLTYTLQNRSMHVAVRTEFINRSDKPLKIAPVDDFRADRTFTTHPAGETDLVWFYDKWWGQAYGVVSPSHKMRLTGSPAEPRAIEFLSDGQPTVTIEPGAKVELVRHVFPGADQIAVKAAAARVRNPKAALVTNEIHVGNKYGPVAGAEIDLRVNGQPYGSARSGADGIIRLDLPPGQYESTVKALGHEPSALKWQASSGTIKNAVGLNVPPRVVAHVTAEDGGPIPCKVQFAGVDGTPNPFFFPDTGEHAVHNLYYSHNGRFTQEIPPGKYDVIVSYGPEYNAERLRIEAKPDEDVPLRATLRRVVQSPGWVSTDFHGHSSPSGDNVSSQFGRVLNLLGEHIEFAPCTEHNRLDTYMPHLKTLGVEKLMGTCTGIELTNQPGTINHQNAFPLVLKPRTQDNGAPLIDNDPAEQIKRLALWDNSSDKLVQTNHPDMGEMFYDRDGDGVPDGGYKGMFAYQDVIEVHPIHDVLSMNPHRFATRVDAKTKEKETLQYNNSIFNWLQLVNQGRRLPGVVNTDAHYNFHGSGFIRNYVKCETDDPSKIDPMDIVHASEKGHVIMTNGPYLEVALYDSDASGLAVTTDRRKAIPGDDLPLPGGVATLHVRVQCPNWFDIDRVQVLLNGRPEKKLNWTRSANADLFSNGVVKFDRKVPIEFKTDTHVIVIAAGENSQLGPVMGPDHGKMRPAAVSNPIFVDADGGGFKPNGDTLGAPLPVKGGKKVEPPKE